MEEEDTAAGYMGGVVAGGDYGGNIVVADAADDGEYCMAVEATVDAVAFDVVAEVDVVDLSRHTIDQWQGLMKSVTSLLLVAALAAAAEDGVATTAERIHQLPRLTPALVLLPKLQLG